MGGLLRYWVTQASHHAKQFAQTAGSEQRRESGRSTSNRTGPACRNELSGASRKLDDEVRLTALEAALQNRKCLPTERVMRGGDTDSFDVSNIQPLGMLVEVPNGTNGEA